MNDNRSRLYAWMGAERRFDLLQLDAKPADLDPKPHSPYTLDTTVRAHAAQVPCPKYSFIAAAGRREERRSSKVRPAPVSRGNIIALDRDLADAVESNLLVVVIKQKDLLALTG